MDFSEAIQNEIVKAAKGLTRVAEELDKINRNPNIQGMEEHKKQVSCTTQALAYSYRLYEYIQRRNEITSTEFTKMSENAQKISKDL